ncbi:RelA/SpoT domain-containing protein [Bifidobacterium biavatii]|uniref:RelA/SpoT domain-containing protein n=1 Tax=Bifidobacterium biavatii DSM 23969 TaxID=1437608 RepID=A0A087A4P3_9BIFI|nr:RelA/SpoT domain-containing protein [Bifidobacterium biavatii]KFI53743.1 hypothetical protein BBIA_1340 [Bifidobacterium biavatii DSM 23969]
MRSDQGIVFPPKPWSQSKISKLRKAIVAGADSIDGLSYADVSQWYMQVLGQVIEVVESVDVSDLGIPSLDVSFRVKTIDTLRDKMIRTPGMQIPSIHDVMGVRVAADMTLSVQSEVASRLAGCFSSASVLDIREHPHSGYRAVHVIVRMCGVCGEIQVRTMLQDLWANCFELAGDMFGRGIRYGGEPDRYDYGISETLKSISEGLASLEALEDVSSSDVTSPVRDRYVSGLSMCKTSLERLLEQRDDADVGTMGE